MTKLPRINVPTPPEDRMPTIEELRALTAAQAWLRLTPEQQLKVGMLGVMCAVNCGLNGYENTYTPDELNEIQKRGDDSLTQLIEDVEPFWQIVFGWCPSQAVDQGHAP